MSLQYPTLPTSGIKSFLAFPGNLKASHCRTSLSRWSSLPRWECHEPGDLFRCVKTNIATAVVARLMLTGYLRVSLKNISPVFIKNKNTNAVFMLLGMTRSYSGSQPLLKNRIKMFILKIKWATFTVVYFQRSYIYTLVFSLLYKLYSFWSIANNN